MPASGNSLLEPDTFLLGTFASNCSGGMTVTKVPERWDNSFANNLRLAQLLDDFGRSVLDEPGVVELRLHPQAERWFHDPALWCGNFR